MSINACDPLLCTKCTSGFFVDYNLDKHYSIRVSTTRKQKVIGPNTVLTKPASKYVIQTGVNPPERATRSKAKEIIDAISSMKPGSDQHYVLTPGELQTWSRYAKRNDMVLKSSALGMSTDPKSPEFGKVRVWRKS